MEVKDNTKMSAAHIKRLATYKAAPVNSDSKKPVRVPHKDKARTGVLPSHKQHVKNITRHYGAQLYCVLCKKAGIPE